MTPASSVLLLTTLTGFGYGLLAWLGAFAAFGILPASAFFLPVSVCIALAFASAGLVASTVHLGHPERAWRAFSQWRSSWLSREGVASMLTFPPALAFGVLWWFLGPDAMATRIMGLLAAVKRHADSRSSCHPNDAIGERCLGPGQQRIKSGT